MATDLKNLIMLKILTALVSGALIATGAWAQDKPTAQQQKMKSCNAQASKKEMKGDKRREFMSQCLSGDSAAAGGGDGTTAQQQKMKSCNAQASRKELKGDKRREFMSDCLSA